MSDRIERFCKTTRFFHWSAALPFLTLAGTGGLLGLRESLAFSPDDVEGLIVVHKGAGVALLVLPPLIALSGKTSVLLADLRAVFRWTRDDLRWLALQPLALLGRAVLPPAEKLNAGQKVNSLLSMGLAAGLGVSGVWLWLQPGALIFWFAHLALFLCWIPVFAGHFFLAVVNPATRPALRGMLLGPVPRRWAAHHHPVWVAAASPEPVTPAESKTRQPVAPAQGVVLGKLVDERS